MIRQATKYCGIFVRATMPKVWANWCPGFQYEVILRELDVHPQGYPQNLGK